VSRDGAPQPARLGPTGVAVLESVYQHRLLSTRQVHALHAPARHLRSAQRALARLRAAGLAARTRLPGGLGLWYLTAQGIEAVEAIPARAETRSKLVSPAQAAGPLQEHTLAVNEVGIAFVRAARERGHECGPFAWRHEIAHTLGPAPGRRAHERLIADALLTYQLTEPGQPTRFHYRFVELDRATMPVDDLAAKLARYVRLHRYTIAAEEPGDPPVPLWTRLYSVFPLVLLVLAGGTRERLERRRETVLALCREDPELGETPEVEVSACLLCDLVERGPFAAIFRTSANPDKRVNWLGGNG